LVSNNYAVTNSQIAVSGIPPTNYRNVETLLVTTGAGTDDTVVNLQGAGVAPLIVIDGSDGAGNGTTTLTVAGTAGNDVFMVTPTDPTLNPTAPAMAGDSVINVGTLALRARGITGDLMLDDNGGVDSVEVRARTTTGQGGGLPEVADGRDMINVVGDGSAGAVQRIQITNATQGALQSILLRDDQFTAGLTVVAGNEAINSLGDDITVVPNADRPVTIQGGSPVLSLDPMQPGDRLTLELNGALTPLLSVSGPGAGSGTFGNRQAVTYSSIENTTARNGTYDLLLSTSAAGVGDDGVADRIETAPILRNVGGVQVMLFGLLIHRHRLRLPR
jgi:hypothetical protein